MSLLRQVQHMVEGQDRPTGVNLEHFVVGPRRGAQLADETGPAADGALRAELTAGGCTFLRAEPRALRLAIYFPETVIAALEADDPRQRLNHRNISPLISFVEEIAHAVHAGFLFLQGQRDFATEDALKNLEAQAKIDTALVLTGFAGLLCGRPLPGSVRAWLDGQLFDRSDRRMSAPVLRQRYRAAETLAWAFLQRLRVAPPAGRPALLRKFRQADWDGKQALGKANSG